MEDNEMQVEKEEEASNLLYKYQYAFLHMQKSFTALFKVVRGIEQRTSFKCVAIWKRKCLTQSFPVKTHLNLIRSTLCAVDIKLRSRYLITTLSYFLRIVNASKVIQFQSNIRNQHELIKVNNNKDIEVMNSEVESLKQSQTELEKITKNYSKREFNLKSKLETLAGKGYKEVLKAENKSLEAKIDEMDRRIIGMFSELNQIVDGFEEAKLKKQSKIKKKSKIIIKTKHAWPISV